MLVALWHILKRCVPYPDLGADCFDRRNTDASAATTSAFSKTGASLSRTYMTSQGWP